MRISDWSSDVCSSDLELERHSCRRCSRDRRAVCLRRSSRSVPIAPLFHSVGKGSRNGDLMGGSPCSHCFSRPRPARRSEEHTSELQSLMRISYAVFCLKKKKTQQRILMNVTLHNTPI